jgi:hypothetical protein
VVRVSGLFQTRFSKDPPPVKWSGPSKIVGLPDRNEAARVFIKSLQNAPDVVDTDELQCPLFRTGKTFTVAPSDHLRVIVFQCEDKMSGLDTPTPPLRTLSTNATE